MKINRCEDISKQNSKETWRKPIELRTY